jgi:hypothetical protein
VCTVLKKTSIRERKHGDDREDEPHRKRGRVLMPGQGCLIRFKASGLATQLVVASSAEVHGEHLVFLHSDGSLAALCVLDMVESWSEIELPGD